MSRSKDKKPRTEISQPAKQASKPPEASKPPAIRNDTELRTHLWNVVEFAERGGQVDARTNADLRNFIASRNSATIYEVLRMKKSVGEPAPDRTSNGKYQLGDRIDVTLIYKAVGNDIIEKHTGIVWNITPGNNADAVTLMLNGKDGGSPYYVNLPVSGGAWWHPSEARDISIKASAYETEDAKELATKLLDFWRQDSEAQQAHQFSDAQRAPSQLGRR